MFSINPVSLLATAALGPMGGILSQLATQALSQAMQQVIQQTGDRMGLPQSAIELAQGDFTASFGDTRGTASNIQDAISELGQQSGANPSDIGRAQRAVEDLIRQAGDSMQLDEVKDAKGAGGKGWLRALAEALGRSADKAAADLEAKANNLDNASPSESAEYNADAQAFGMLMSAINNAIKTIGEGLNQMARKQ